MAMYQGKSTRGRGQHCIGLPSTPSPSPSTPTRARTRERVVLYRREKIYTREREKGKERDGGRAASSIGVAQQSEDCEQLREPISTIHVSLVSIICRWSALLDMYRFIDGNIDSSYNLKSNLEFDLNQIWKIKHEFYVFQQNSLLCFLRDTCS